MQFILVQSIHKTHCWTLIRSEVNGIGIQVLGTAKHDKGSTLWSLACWIIRLQTYQGFNTLWGLACWIIRLQTYQGFNTLWGLACWIIRLQTYQGFNTLWSLACWIIRLQTYQGFNTLWNLVWVGLSGCKHISLGSINCTINLNSMKPTPPRILFYQREFKTTLRPLEQNLRNTNNQIDYQVQ